MALYKRTDRVTSLMRQLAATFIRNEANADPLITVTDVDVSPDLKQATVFVSVFPEAQEADALIFLKRKGGALRSFVKQNAVLKDIPFFDFAHARTAKNHRFLDELEYKRSKKGANESQ